MIKTWDQADILSWAESRFGVHSTLSICIRMNKEMAELMSALGHEELEVARGEVADMGVMLKQIAQKLGIDLDAAVDAKMNVNEARQWEKQADGSYQHV